MDPKNKKIKNKNWKKKRKKLQQQKNKIQKKTINSENHQKNGNIVKKNYKIATWNKGNSLIKNSIQILQKALTEEKIDICGIQEYNLRDIDDTNILKIPGYSIITDSLRESNQISRAAIAIKDGIKYRVRPDLSSQTEAQVAVTIQVTKKVSFNIHSWYRQWQMINKDGRIKDTLTTKAQKSRLSSAAANFKKSIQEQETIILADTNINSLHLNTPYDQKTPSGKQMNTITELYKK